MVEQIDFKFGFLPAALDFGKNSIGLIEFALMPSPAIQSYNKRYNDRQPLIFIDVVSLLCGLIKISVQHSSFLYQAQKLVIAQGY